MALRRGALSAAEQLKVDKAIARGVWYLREQLAPGRDWKQLFGQHGTVERAQKGGVSDSSRAGLRCRSRPNGVSVSMHSSAGSPVERASSRMSRNSSRSNEDQLKA